LCVNFCLCDSDDCVFQEQKRQQAAVELDAWRLDARPKLLRLLLFRGRPALVKDVESLQSAEELAFLREMSYLKFWHAGDGLELVALTSTPQEVIAQFEGLLQRVPLKHRALPLLGDVLRRFPDAATRSRQDQMFACGNGYIPRALQRLQLLHGAMCTLHCGPNPPLSWDATLLLDSLTPTQYAALFVVGPCCMFPWKDAAMTAKPIGRLPRALRRELLGSGMQRRRLRSSTTMLLFELVKLSLLQLHAEKSGHFDLVVEHDGLQMLVPSVRKCLWEELIATADRRAPLSVDESRVLAAAQRHGLDAAAIAREIGGVGVNAADELRQWLGDAHDADLDASLDPLSDVESSDDSGEQPPLPIESVPEYEPPQYEEDEQPGSTKASHHKKSAQQGGDKRKLRLPQSAITNYGEYSFGEGGGEELSSLELAREDDIDLDPDGLVEGTGSTRKPATRRLRKRKAAKPVFESNSSDEILATSSDEDEEDKSKRGRRSKKRSAHVRTYKEDDSDSLELPSSDNEDALSSLSDDVWAGDKKTGKALVAKAEEGKKKSKGSSAGANKSATKERRGRPPKASKLGLSQHGLDDDLDLADFDDSPLPGLDSLDDSIDDDNKAEALPAPAAAKKRRVAASRVSIFPFFLI
jgi:hypothetical protein